MLRIGDPAPDFEAPCNDGRQLRLRDFRGRRHVVLYFFPRDFTPGCTKEACSFRDHRAEVAALDGEIVGVSLDPVERHAAFAEKYRLPFPLVSDTSGRIAAKYGVARLGGWLPTKRVTFVIDKEGTIRNVIHSEFGIDRHIDGALATLRELQNQPGAPSKSG
jgi:peroxiredoxin Q/BCP